MPHNYLNDTSTFFDASSASLMASSVYRLAILSKQYNNIPAAESFRNALANNTALTPGATSPNNGTVSVDSSGWLMPVVNPLSFGSGGAQSPEGESFVLLMEAARASWVQDGEKGQKGAAASRISTSRLEMGVAALLLGGALAVGGHL